MMDGCGSSNCVNDGCGSSNCVKNGCGSSNFVNDGCDSMCMMDEAPYEPAPYIYTYVHRMGKS